MPNPASAYTIIQGPLPFIRRAIEWGNINGGPLHTTLLESMFNEWVRESETAKGGASGAVLAQGGRYGGWSPHLRDGKPAYQYRWLGLERFVVESPTVMPEGKSTVTHDPKAARRASFNKTRILI